MEGRVVSSPDDGFWSGPLDHLPADLQDGDEGSLVIPSISPDLLALLVEAAREVRSDPAVRHALAVVADQAAAAADDLAPAMPVAVAVGLDHSQFERLADAIETLSMLVGQARQLRDLWWPDADRR